ncbi:MAG: 23S rRNA (guanosine(2251)-2'-O)-methyltransferase RlmB, partial [Glaciimonas sp.]|nr:23S rRNA (guanosine(2251)-2'-O)-methyltransferase RlmB [Glaciimonas sp.]
MAKKMIFGFHAVTARLRHEAASIAEIYVDASRVDARMKELRRVAKEHNIHIIPVDDQRLNTMMGTRRHQGVVAMTEEISLARNLYELL